MLEVFKEHECEVFKNTMLRELAKAGRVPHEGAHPRRTSAVTDLYNMIARHVSVLDGTDAYLEVRNTTTALISRQLRLGTEARVNLASEWRQIDWQALRVVCATRYPEHKLPDEDQWRGFVASIKAGSPCLKLHRLHAKKKDAPEIVFGASQPAVEPAVRPAVEPVPEPVDEPAYEPAYEPVPEPVVKPAVRPAVKPAVKPADEPKKKKKGATTQPASAGGFILPDESQTTEDNYVQSGNRPASQYIPEAVFEPAVPIRNDVAWLKKLPAGDTLRGVLARGFDATYYRIAHGCRRFGENKPVVIGLFGNAGLGKSYQSEAMCREVCAKFYRITAINRDTAVTGYEKPLTPEYVASELVMCRKSACENPGLLHVFQIDEVDALSPEVQMTLLPVFAEGTLSSIHTGRMRFPNNIMFIMSANTTGSGSDDTYTARYPIDHALLDRAIPYTVRFERDTALAIVGDSDRNRALVDWCIAWNDACERQGALRLLASYRTITDVLAMMCDGFSEDIAIASKFATNHTRMELNAVFNAVDDVTEASWIKASLKKAIAKVRD